MSATEFCQPPLLAPAAGRGREGVSTSDTVTRCYDAPMGSLSIGDAMEHVSTLRSLPRAGGRVSAEIRPNRRGDFPPGTRVVRHVDKVPGIVVEQPPGEHVVVWWDNGVRARHHIVSLLIEVAK